MNLERPKLLGVVGHPVAHSASPALFAQRFAELGREDLEYRKFDLPRVEDFPALLEAHPGLVGLNVTVPHKKSVVPYLDSLSPEARALSAVNTLVKTTDGWHGHNTDVWGFRRAVGPFLANRHERALVLGTGGSAAAVHHVLAELGIEAVSVSRSGDTSAGSKAFGRPCLGYHELAEWTLKHHLLVVNCTPVGMSPRVDEMPDLPVQFLTPNHLVVDLIYNPKETRLLREARSQGAEVLNGADMLRLQAEKAWEIWTEAGV